MTEGQPPVTNGLEVGIAAIVTIVRAVLGQFAQSFLEFVTMVAGEGQLRAVFQDDAIFSMKPGL